MRLPVRRRAVRCHVRPAQPHVIVRTRTGGDRGEVRLDSRIG
jgi:hypothetical protein